MSAPIIATRSLGKSFRSMKKSPGGWAGLKSIVHPEYVTHTALHDVSFTIHEGEFVGLIGPNGAGKTTILKLISGLMDRSSGSATVLGYTPFERRSDFLRQISMVMGQKSQMWWELPPTETFLLHKDIYSINDTDYQTRLRDLIDLLDLAPHLQTPVRGMSLGTRMKCELVASLLHAPRVLFLDEPTIGLDVTAQKNLRDFLKAYNHKTGSTIMLTSHYMEDVRSLCPRVIIIQQGRIIFDGQLADIIRRYADFKEIEVTTSTRAPLSELGRGVLETQQIPTGWQIKVTSDHVAQVTQAILSTQTVSDIAIHEPRLEDIIRQIFHSHQP